MKTGKILISAMIFLFFIFSSTNFAIAENENITLTDPRGDVAVYSFADLDNINDTQTTDEVPNVDIKELVYVHNQGSKKATIILQVYGKIEDRGSLDESSMIDMFSTVAYSITLTTSKNNYLINYVNKTCAIGESEFDADFENITDWSVNNDKLTINIDLKNSDETYLEIAAQTTDIDIDFSLESLENGEFYLDAIPNSLSVIIEKETSVEKVGNSIQFNAYAEDQLGVSGDYTYNWNFGDGSPISNLKNPTHTYNSVGNYTVILTVEDDLGNIGNDTTLITITQEDTNGNNNGNDGEDTNGSESGLNLFITIIAVIVIIGILILIFIIRR